MIKWHILSKFFFFLKCFSKWALWTMSLRQVIFQSTEDELLGLSDIATCVRQTSGCHSAVHCGQNDVSVWFGRFEILVFFGCVDYKEL